MKLQSIGEEEIVERFLKFVDSPMCGEALPIGDDGRDILINSSRIILSIDGYSIKAARLPWRSLSDVGWCAVTGAVSDVVSKGGVPQAMLISVGMPREWDVDEAVELMKGVREAADVYGVRILGGDTNESEDPWISIAMLGCTSANKLPPRSGGRPGDYVLVTGCYGAMGIVCIEGIEKGGEVSWVVESTRRPKASVDLAKVICEEPNAFHASMDVSDGLGYTLLTIAKLSRVALEITEPPQYHAELIEYCGGDRTRLWKYILSGGEEYGVVLLVDPEKVELIRHLMNKYNITYKVIGRAVKPQNAPQVIISGYGSIEISRWDQFKGWI